MILRRLAHGLVALSALHPATALATTAASLSDRIQPDGRVAEYETDEWVLDATSAFPEAADDSRWGSDNDVARVALTWDRARLYLAVEFTAAASGVLVMIANGPGGVPALDAAGEFRRAIDLPFDANLLLLAAPGSVPRVARADASHAFALVDGAAVPAVVARDGGAVAGFEAWIPWTLVDPVRPLRVVVVLTGDTGSGAGDAAPDTRTALTTDRFARAVVDRWITITADADGDGAADTGVSPRALVAVEPDAAPAVAPGDADLAVVVKPAVFAPDRNETAVFTVESDAGPVADVSGRCVIHAMDGRRIRVLPIAASGTVSEVSVVWDGRDDSGRACSGGVYVAAFDLEFTAAGARQRATKRAGVAVAR